MWHVQVHNRLTSVSFDKHLTERDRGQYCKGGAGAGGFRGHPAAFLWMIDVKGCRIIQLHLWTLIQPGIYLPWWEIRLRRLECNSYGLMGLVVNAKNGANSYASFQILKGGEKNIKHMQQIRYYCVNK